MFWTHRTYDIIKYRPGAQDKLLGLKGLEFSGQAPGNWPRFKTVQKCWVSGSVAEVSFD